MEPTSPDRPSPIDRELPQWYEPPPRSYKYPWSIDKLTLPLTKDVKEAQSKVAEIRSQGDDCFKKGDSYNALWKYEHALFLCYKSKYPSLKEDMSIVHCNIAAICLKMGDNGNREFLNLDLLQTDPSVHWYVIAQRHSSNAFLHLDPDSEIFAQAFYQRKESLEKIFFHLNKSKEVIDMVMITDSLFSSQSKPFHSMVRDYAKCLPQQKSPDPKIFCDALIFAVDHGCVKQLPKLGDRHNRSEMTSKLLPLLVSNENSKEDHIDYLMYKLELKSCRSFVHGSASSVSPSQLLKKNIWTLPLYMNLIDCGMKVTVEDIVELCNCEHPKLKLQLMKFLLDKYECKQSDRVMYDKAIEAAKQHDVDKKFIVALKAHPAIEIFFHGLVDEGSKHYLEKGYSEAHKLYVQALEHCTKYDLKGHREDIRIKCAVVCLEQKMYSCAYDYCVECITFNESNHSAYFYRAEALKGNLLEPEEERQKNKSFKDVMDDYLKCHELHPHLDALYNAIILGQEKNLMKSIPKLQHDDIKNGVSAKLLEKVVSDPNTTEALLQFVLFELPSPSIQKKAYAACRVDLIQILSKTSNCKLIEHLVLQKMKIKVIQNQTQVVTAALLIPAEDIDTFKFILNCTKKEDYDPGILIDACLKAIHTLKIEFVAELIKKGATPPLESLTGLDVFSDNPTIQTYVTSQATSQLLVDADKLPKVAEEVLDEKQIKEKVQNLCFEAKQCHDTPGNHKGALRKYFEALDVCTRGKFSEEVACIHSKCAETLLQVKSYRQAYRHADASVNLCSSNDEAYIWRAEALTKILEDDTFAGCHGLSNKNIIADYCRGHALKSNTEAITKAVLLAVDKGLGSELTACIATMETEYCNSILLKILSHKECNETHLEFLLVQNWNEKRIDVSKITLRQLLEDTVITSARLLQKFIDLGLPLSEKEVKIAIGTLKSNQEHLFATIASKIPYSATAYYDLCQAALHAKRSNVLSGLVARDSISLILEAMRQKDHATTLAIAKALPENALCKLDLSSLVDRYSWTKVDKFPEIVKTMITAGLSPNGIGNSHPISVAMSKGLKLSERIGLISILLDNGADCKYLCGSKETTTPLHVATKMALESGGDTRLILSVMRSSTFDPSKTTNDKNETPLHLAVKSNWKKNVCESVLPVLLESKRLDPMKKDRYNKRPIDYRPNDESDALYCMLKTAMESRKPESSLQQRKGAKVDTSYYAIQDARTKESSKTRNKNSSHSTSQDKQQTETDHEDKSKGEQGDYDLLAMPQKLDFHIKRVMAMDKRYFQVSMTTTPTSGLVGPQVPIQKSLEKPIDGQTHTDDQLVREKAVSSAKECKLGAMDPESSEDTGDVSDLFTAGRLNFDDLLWEVEVTSNVVKFFKNVKKHSKTDRKAAARTIESLAKGRRNDHLSRQIACEKSLQLFEARMTKAARILWEKAISYSPKLTGDSPFPVYTQVIRVWEIVLHHDDLDKQIKYCAEQIKKSINRGCEASARLSLQAQGQEVIHKSAADKEKVPSRERIDMPVVFIQSSENEMETDHQFIPATSMKDNEYNVATFHVFDTLSVKSMLLGTNARRDYPIKEWPKEHEIIKLTSKEAILLLGRSGTGKSTCCLYRLWNQFKNFWNPDSDTFSQKILHRCLTPICDHITLPIDAGEDEYDCSAPQQVDMAKQEQETAKVGITSQNECTSDVATPSCTAPTESIVEENLHQVFITKNRVLCDLMRKHFYKMVAAFDFLDEHMKHENENTHSICDLSAINDYAYPLFLSAREFYILLDKSLGEDNRFFKWSRDGELEVKIISRDYEDEDPDILFDFEQSDSEDDEMEGGSSATTRSPSKGHSERWTEVTALYFKEFIWPNVSHQCGISSKDFDPLLVWMEIQSFIKGSETALRKGTHLNLEEYKQIGNRMAPNFSSHRDTIYKVFLKYQKYQQNQRHHNFLFDECDLVLNLYNRLKEVQDVPWSIHSVFIDEVQDFTQAELTTIIHCCRNPNSMFFTGDTAQSIMRGIMFRFEDLQSIFYRLNSTCSYIKVPKKPLTLTTNFRSHSGIIKLAGSVIDLIREYFKGSIDDLPDEVGMFPGPTPVVLRQLEQYSKDGLALLLNANKREASAIEFGAHQVILVQSKEAKDNLPSILKGAIVLTIFEAKGLEFDDVLLYNFFTDSMVDEKDWRVVSSYLEMTAHRNKITNHEKLPGSSVDPRSRQFDSKLHKSLNAELKYLYTAITRARCNLWIYDENINACLPVFDYWYKRDLVKVVHETKAAESLDIVFASNSKPEQWKAQGDNFKKKGLWETAMLCYKRAGSENEYLAKEIHAGLLRQHAKKQKHLYLEASVTFFECDEAHHDVRYLRAAACCLIRAKPPRYSEAGKLYEHFGDINRATELYKKGKDFENLVKLGKKLGEYIKLFKESKMYDKAFDVMVDNEMFKDAFRLATAQGGSLSGAKWLQRGIEIAEKINNESVKASLVFQMAKMNFKRLSHDSTTDSEHLYTNLKNFHKSSDFLIKAEAHLLHGILNRDAESCHNAWKLYHSLDHRIGQLEAFNQTIHLSREHVNDHMQTLMIMCHVADETSNVFSKGSYINKVIKEGLKFYGLQKVGAYYYVPPELDIWIGEPLMKCACETNPYDPDGMIRLEASKVWSVIATHCQSLKNAWLSECDTDTKKLEARLQSFAPHEDLLKHHKLLKSYSMVEVSTEQLSDYIRTIIEIIELDALVKGNADSFHAILVSVFTPEVCIYLHQQCKASHVSLVRTHQSVALGTQFQSLIKVADDLLGKQNTFTCIDSLLTAWRVSCISKPVMRSLQKLEKHMNDEANAVVLESETRKCSLGFIHLENEGRYRFCHIFSLWLQSCSLIREKGRFLWASQFAINHFLGNIVKQPDIFSLGALNVVNILCIHCTGILAMLSHIRCLQRYPMPLTIPLLYKSIVNIFSAMNNWKSEDKHVLTACADEVSRSKNIKDLFWDSYQLLLQALKFLLGNGECADDCSILRVGLETAPSSEATKQCLILTFVLLGNLSMLCVPNIQENLTKLHSLLHPFLQQNNSAESEPPRHVAMAYEATKNTRIFDPPEVFELVQELLRDANLDSTLALYASAPCNEIAITPVEEQRQESISHGSSDKTHDLGEENLIDCRTSEMLSRINPEFVDSTYSFCNACGVELQDNYHPLVDASSENKKQSNHLDSEAKESYLTHAESDLHHSNVTNCKQYAAEVYPNEVHDDTMVSTHKGTVLYHTLHHDLTNLLADYRALKTVVNSDKLDQPISDIEEELDRNDKKLSELEDKYEWEEAIKRIAKMKKSMDELLNRYTSHYYGKLVVQQQEMEVEDDASELESDDEELDTLLKVGEELDDSLRTKKLTELRSEDDKLQSRRKKKNKSSAAFVQAAN